MKHHYLWPILLLISCSPAKKEKCEPIYSQMMVETHGLGDFYCNRHHQAKLDTTGWDYVSGLVAHSVLKAWSAYPEKKAYYDAVKAFADNSLNEDGTFIHNKKGKDALRPSNIDDLPAGNIFFGLYEEEMRQGDTLEASKYKTAATLIRNRLKYDHSRIKAPLPGAGCFFHKAVYPNQVWLDGLFMGSPIYAQWQAKFGKEDTKDNNESWSDIALQFKTIHQYSYNAEKQLNYHAWTATPEDENSFWAQQDGKFKGCSPEFWARSMGWYIAALVDVLEFMPREHADYPAMHRILNEVAAGLKRWQDPKSGVWYQLLQYDHSMAADGKGDTISGKVYNVGTQPNYLESSASAIFTYAFLKGIRLGLLDEDEYLPVAEKAYNGILKQFVRQEGNKTHIIQVCASAGLGPKNNPSRTGTINYYLAGKDVTITENEGKAIGSFIMASVEWELMKR